MCLIPCNHQITPEVSKEEYDTFIFKSLFHNERFAYEKIFPKLEWSEQFPK